MLLDRRDHACTHMVDLMVMTGEGRTRSSTRDGGFRSGLLGWVDDANQLMELTLVGGLQAVDAGAICRET